MGPDGGVLADGGLLARDEPGSNGSGRYSSPLGGDDDHGSRQLDVPRDETVDRKGREMTSAGVTARELVVVFVDPVGEVLLVRSEGVEQATVGLRTSSDRISIVLEWLPVAETTPFLEERMQRLEDPCINKRSNRITPLLVQECEELIDDFGSKLPRDAAENCQVLLDRSKTRGGPFSIYPWSVEERTERT